MSEYIIEIPDYVPPFDPAVRTASLGEEIVRCRDCGKSIVGERCMRHESSGWSGNTWVVEYEQVDPNGFCAWGERRDA